MKTWSKEHFAQVVHQLSKKYDCSFFIVGAPEDRAYADEVIGTMQLPVANFCGRTDLIDLAAILKNVHLFLTVDTGAAHIAATVDVPMVVVYGCTSPKRWHPLSDKAIVFTSGEPCCPCTASVEDCPDTACLQNIKAEDVLASCVQQLDN